MIYSRAEAEQPQDLFQPPKEKNDLPEAEPKSSKDLLFKPSILGHTQFDTVPEERIKSLKLSAR